MAQGKQQRFARAKERLPIRLSMKDGDREFQATIYSTDISVSGIFLASDFFLKVGTELDLEFTMPNDDRVVRTRGVIVREVRLDEGGRRPGAAGFAMRFTEYYADAKTVLASSFLVVELDDFVEDFLERRSRRPINEREALREVLIAWEVGKMDLVETEQELLRGRLKVDETGKIRRRSGASGNTRKKVSSKKTASTPARVKRTTKR